MMRLLSLAVVLLVLPSAAQAQQRVAADPLPARGVVPDSATAVRIAIAVWMPVYREQSVMAEQPFVATLQDNVWTVTGTMRPADTAGSRDAVRTGGTFLAKIAKRDGRILALFLYQ
jgi:hypothetical protein